MKKLLDKILSPQVFAIAYLPWLAINMVSVINILDFTRVFLVAFAVWAVAVCVKLYLFSGKQPWTHKSMGILLLFIAACLVSQVLQFQYGGIAVLGKMCYFSLCLLILYSQYRSDAAEYHRTLRAIVCALGITIGVLMLVSDWMFIDLFSASITGRSGATIYVGFAENRLFGIFSSPNVGGTYALILIWCSALLFKWAEEMRGTIVWRTVSVIQIILAMMYISVALSRGTHVSGLVLVIAYLIVRAPLAKEKTLAVWKQVAIRAASIAAAVGVCVVALNAFNWVSCELMTWNYQQKVAGSEIENEEEMLEIIENAKLGSEGRVEAGREDIDFTNKRSSIWSAHLGLLKGKHLFIGVNNPLVYFEKNLEAGQSFTDEQKIFIPHAAGNMHNGYLQILVTGGLLALIPMAIFLILCIVKVLRYLGGTLFSGRLSMETKAYELFSLTLPIVLAILVNNVFETNFVLMGANFIQAFFWMVAGACVQSMREGVEK